MNGKRTNEQIQELFKDKTAGWNNKHVSQLNTKETHRE